jgi:endonuclease/exonuclease/phosphatase family metal-dependent hydrolase
MILMESDDRHGLTTLQRSFDLGRIYRKGCVASPAAPAEQRILRILTWNIDRGHRPERIAEVLTSLAPDVACLQEVDWGNQRTGSVDVLEEIADRTGMLGLFGIEFLELNTPQRDARLRGGGATGNAILTRFEPHLTFRMRLPASLDWSIGAQNPSLSPLARWRLRREPRLGERFGLGMELAMGERIIRVCSLHLEDKHGGVAGRWSQYMAAVQHLEARAVEGAIDIIAGDFNTFDNWIARFVSGDTDATALGKSCWRREADWWRDHLLPATGYQDPFQSTDWTFSATRFFRAKLDWITLRGAQALDRGIGSFCSSDHRPIWVDIDLTASRHAEAGHTAT